MTKQITMDYSEYVDIMATKDKLGYELQEAVKELNLLRKNYGYLAVYDNGDKVALDSYAGGANPNGAWSELSLLFESAKGVVSRRYYAEVFPYKRPMKPNNEQ